MSFFHKGISEGLLSPDCLLWKSTRGENSYLIEKIHFAKYFKAYDFGVSGDLLDVETHRNHSETSVSENRFSFDFLYLVSIANPLQKQHWAPSSLILYFSTKHIPPTFLTEKWTLYHCVQFNHFPLGNCLFGLTTKHIIYVCMRGFQKAFYIFL